MTCCGADFETTFCPNCGLANQDRLHSIQIAPSATPSRRNSAPPRTPNNSFEKGKRLDERGIPFLNREAKPLLMKDHFDKSKYRDTVTLGQKGNG